MMYVTQLVVYLQLLVVLQKIDVNWDEPFLLLLEVFSIMSLNEFVKSLHVLSCVTYISPTSEFLLQTLAVPAFFMLAPSMHVILMVVPRWRSRRRGNAKLHVLFETIGSLSVLFFIVLCTAVVVPLQCHEHPNGVWTLQTSVKMVCNFTGVHLQLCVIGAVLGLLPLGFLSLCAWAVLHEFPRRVKQGDMSFISAFSFLVLRFSPGHEGFAIFLLLRNMLFALAPVFPSASTSLLLIQALVCSNLFGVSFFKPWRTLHGTYADILASAIFLIVILQAAFFVSDVDKASSSIPGCALDFRLFLHIVWP